jgi:hypothetical protein
MRYCLCQWAASARPGQAALDARDRSETIDLIDQFHAIVWRRFGGAARQLV